MNTTTAKTIEVKTIDIYAKEWFDKSAGNSYFSANVIVNYKLPDEMDIYLPMQYGYDTAYIDQAFRKLIKDGILNDVEENEVYWRYCDRKEIVLRTSKQENCKKREL